MEYKHRPPDLNSEAFPKQRLRSDGVTSENTLEVSLSLSSQALVSDSIEKWKFRKCFKINKKEPKVNCGIVVII